MGWLFFGSKHSSGNSMTVSFGRALRSKVFHPFYRLRMSSLSFFAVYIGVGVSHCQLQHIQNSFESAEQKNPPWQVDDSFEKQANKQPTNSCQAREDEEWNLFGVCFNKIGGMSAAAILTPAVHSYWSISPDSPAAIIRSKSTRMCVYLHLN